MVTFGATFAILSALIVTAMSVGYFQAHFKRISNFPQPGQSRWHFAAWRFRFYDNTLNKRVRYARHALAVDETRKDFDRVPWASPEDRPDRTGEPEWLRQVWFAGNHSDIGGSYAEDESRLSDISLGWMIEQASELPAPLRIDASRLRLSPDPGGMQHCEVAAMRDGYPTWWPRKLHAVWSQRHREVLSGAPLHPSVQTRLAMNGVSHYGVSKPYRPANLARHDVASAHYPPADEMQVATSTTPSTRPA